MIINITSKNVDDYKALIELIEKTTIKKIVFISSTSVYKDTNNLVSELDNAESEFSELFQIENLFRNNNHFKTTVVRFSGLIGYSRNPAKFFPEGKPIKNPQSPVNLIHRDDCIQIIVEIVDQDCWHEVFNGCADTHPSKQDFYTQAILNTGRSAPEIEVSSKSVFKIIDNSHLKSCLSYEFIHPDLMAISFT